MVQLTKGFAFQNACYNSHGINNDVIRFAKMADSFTLLQKGAVVIWALPCPFLTD
jgi:hypothetical protein